MLHRMKSIRGISNANKGMLMAAMAYHPSASLRTGLKKYLKFKKNRVEIATKSAEKHLLDLFTMIRLILKPNLSLQF
jgi:hypothetical protein